MSNPSKHGELCKVVTNTRTRLGNPFPFDDLLSEPCLHNLFIAKGLRVMDRDIRYAPTADTQVMDWMIVFYDSPLLT